MGLRDYGSRNYARPRTPICLSTTKIQLCKGVRNNCDGPYSLWLPLSMFATITAPFVLGYMGGKENG